MLISSQLSFRATWYPLHPNAAKSQFLSVFLCVFLSVLKHRHKWKSTEFFPPGFLCDWGERVAIFALPGDYTFLQGLPSLLKHSPLRDSLSRACTHTLTHTHTGQPIKLLQYLGRAVLQRRTALHHYQLFLSLWLLVAGSKLWCIFLGLNKMSPNCWPYKIIKKNTQQSRVLSSDVLSGPINSLYLK